MTTTSPKGFMIGPPIPDIEGGSKCPRALNNPVGGAVTWRRGFVNQFLRVPIACLGIKTAAVQLWNSQIILYKTSSQSNSPAWYLLSVL